MTDNDWLNEYIGIPYKLNGRDRNGVDCWGLIYLIGTEHYNYQMPVWGVERDNAFAMVDVITKAVQVAKDAKQCKRIDGPQDGAIIVCVRSLACVHIALMVGANVLHSSKDAGQSVLEPFSVFSQSGHGKIEFYQWQS